MGPNLELHIITMCHTDLYSYYTKGGPVQIKQKLDTIEKAKLQELEKSQATQLDIFLIRSSLSDTREVLDSLREKFEDHIASHKEWNKIQDEWRDRVEAMIIENQQALFVDVKNGDGNTHTKTVGEVVEDNYNNLRLFRDLNRIYAALMAHKTLSVIALATLIVFHDPIFEAVREILAKIALIIK